MKVSDVLTEVEMNMEETQNQRDARVEQLWRKLDHQQRGELDWRGLQQGLRKIDHPLKNADELLKRITNTVDTNGDGKIQYEEFRVFVEATERQLFLLFKSIDRDNNGRLDKEELQTAFQRVGLAVPQRRLNTFFEDMDMNKDGFVSFAEWRDFLLFMPNDNHANAHTTLHTVLSFYSDVVVLNPEGDSIITEETLEGLGTTSTSLLQVIFGSIFRLASPPELQGPKPGLRDDPPTTASEPAPDAAPSPATARHVLAQHPSLAASLPGSPAGVDPAASATEPLSPYPDADQTANQLLGIRPGMPERAQVEEFWLIRYLPQIGYYIAGAAAGGISRTATAPLDRLKVYLLVNTKSDTHAAVDAVKTGRPVDAIRNFSRSLSRAMTQLYTEGGLRGFWAGNGLNVVKIMPETAIRFGTYEAAKRALAELEGHGDIHHIHWGSKFVAGGVAGMTAQLCVYPVDTLKFRLQSEYTQDGARGRTLLIKTWQQMWAEGRWRAAYRGVTMGLVGMFPYSAFDMFTFEFLKGQYVTWKARKSGRHEEDIQPPTWLTGVFGAFSGALGATIVYPLNVLRTRLQTQGTRMHPARYTGIADVARKTWRHEGYRGLYKGLTPNIMKVAPALSITWVVYERAKDFMSLN